MSFWQATIRRIVAKGVHSRQFSSGFKAAADAFSQAASGGAWSKKAVTFVATNFMFVIIFLQIVAQMAAPHKKPQQKKITQDHNRGFANSNHQQQEPHANHAKAVHSPEHDHNDATAHVAVDDGALPSISFPYQTSFDVSVEAPSEMSLRRQDPLLHEGNCRSTSRTRGELSTDALYDPLARR